MRRVAGGPILLHIKFSYWKLQITNFTLYERRLLVEGFCLDLSLDLSRSEDGECRGAELARAGMIWQQVLY